MDLPTIQLNIFKKLEYFTFIKRLDAEYKAQLTQYETSVMLGIQGVVSPTWGFEQKILYWAALNHRHLAGIILLDWLKPAESDGRYSNNKLNEFFSSEDEAKSVGPERALENLVVRGFADKAFSRIGGFVGIRLTQKGFDLCDLVFHLYYPRSDNTRGMLLECYKFGDWFRWHGLELQLASLPLLYILTGFTITVEILKWVGIEKVFYNLTSTLAALAVISIVIAPLATLTIGMILEKAGDWMWRSRIGKIKSLIGVIP